MKNTDCRKCGESMPEPTRGRGNSPIDLMPMTITAYRCKKCGHVNNLKRRKEKKS